jgi:hypothetical protein
MLGKCPQQQEQVATYLLLTKTLLERISGDGVSASQKCSEDGQQGAHRPFNPDTMDSNDFAKSALGYPV